MKKIILLLTCLWISMGLALAQDKQVTGTVVDEAGEPVIGASVIVKGTTIGTVTDVSGNFSLTVSADAATLVVSYIGMEPTEAAKSPNMKIMLTATSTSLEEVLVVAYGTAKKTSFTGSAELIGKEKISKRPVANVTKALDGAVAGVQTTSGSGQPGAGADVRIRGYGSINASNNPLYVVDGVPYSGSISAINPNDIESMTILKDASAGALYGARGANGVVLITTKKGANGKIQINLKANWGVTSRALSPYETLDEAGFIENHFHAYRNGQIRNGVHPDNAGAAAINAMIAANIFGNNEMYNPYNYRVSELIDPVTGKVRPDAQLRYSDNWLDEVTAKNPLRQEYILNVTGGDKKTKYMFSLGYLNEEGLLETTSFDRFSGRANVETELHKWIKSGLNINFARNTSNTSNTSTSANSNVFYSAQLMGPLYPVYERNAENQIIYDAGKPVFDYGKYRPSGASGGFNSVATLYDDKYATQSENVSARTFVEFGNFKDTPLDGLKLTANFGADYQGAALMTYYNPYFGNSASVKGTIARENIRFLAYIFNQLLTYDKEFGDHHVEVLLGHEFWRYQYNTLSASKTGFPFGDLYELAAATTITDATSNEDNYAIEGIFSRINYDFDDKYYLSGSFRRDASSRFHVDNRWGNYWSAGASWRISEEDFMEDFDWLDNLTLKASHGIQGNDNINSLYAWQSFYNLTYPNAALSGALVSSLENKELTWEKNANTNIGIEAKFLEKYSATVEWYNRLTSDLLLEYPMALSTGFESYYRNVGEMKNTGLEFTLSGNFIKTNDLSYTLTLIGAINKNKVTSLYDKDEITSGSYIIREGETLNSFYVAKAAGVDPATGAQLYWATVDKDNNEVEPYVTADESFAQASRYVAGDRIPDLYGSFTNEFKYKGIDLSVMCTYSIGGKILDGVYLGMLYPYYPGQAGHVDRDKAWRNPGDVTDIPRLDISKNYITTDNSLIDASYLSIKNVTLGYTFSSKVIKDLGLENIRLSATGDNLFLFSHRKGMDPQYNFSGGTTYVYYPTRVISFGIDVKF